jgi:hypothetical protein
MLLQPVSMCTLNKIQILSHSDSVLNPAYKLDYLAYDAEKMGDMLVAAVCVFLMTISCTHNQLGLRLCYS